MNFELARQNMVEQQIRTWEVLDERVLDVMGALPREDFVPTAYRRLAFSDQPLPLAHDQTMMKPIVEGRLLQALAIRPGARVLEIGTGTGFLTACMARLGAQLTSVDIFEDFIQDAGSRLRALDLDQAKLVHADALSGFVPDGRFDAIAVTGALPAIPTPFDEWLEVGGRMFAITGASPAMEVLLITRASDHEFVTESLFETDLPYLIGAEPDLVFDF